MEAREVHNILSGKVSEFAEKIQPIYETLNWKWGWREISPIVSRYRKSIRRTIG
jgi:hypothetical protein